MKKLSTRAFWALPFVLGAIVLVYFLMNVQKCEPGVWVAHLNLCADFAAEGEEGYSLIQTEVCSEEEEACRSEYAGVDGKVLDLPDEVSAFLTSLSMPHSFSPYLEQVAYVETKGSLAVLHVYDLRTQIDFTVQGFGPSHRGLSGFEWDGDERFSFVAIELNASEQYRATRYTYQWTGELWALDGEEQVEGEVECNPIYCELQ